MSPLGRRTTLLLRLSAETLASLATVVGLASILWLL